MSLIYLEDHRVIQGEDWVLIGMEPMERALFLTVVGRIKEYGGVYIPDIKSWFIRRDNFDPLIRDVSRLECFYNFDVQP